MRVLAVSKGCPLFFALRIMLVLLLNGISGSFSSEHELVNANLVRSDVQQCCECINGTSITSTSIASSIYFSTDPPHAAAVETAGCVSEVLLGCLRAALGSAQEKRAASEEGEQTRTRLSKFVVIQYMTANLHGYGAYALGCTALYCEQHGHRLQLFDDADVQRLSRSISAPSCAADASCNGRRSIKDLPDPLALELDLDFEDVCEPGRDQRWTKVWLLYHVMRQQLLLHEKPAAGAAVAEAADYLVWMDSDLILLDMQAALQRFSLSFPQAQIIISRDFKEEHGLVNSGLFIVRVSRWSLAFLKQWWGNARQRSSEADQGVFSAMYRALSSPQRCVGTPTGARAGAGTELCDAVLLGLPVDEAVAILEPHALNSKFPVWYEQEAAHQVLHLAGVMDVYRRIVFQSALRTIWRGMERNHSATSGSRQLGRLHEFPKQLNLGRQQLWELLQYTRCALISRVQRLQRQNPVMHAEQLQHVQEQIQAARQLGYAPLDVQLRRREREAWAAYSASRGAVGNESEAEELQEVKFYSWEAAVLEESRTVSGMLMWVAEAWEGHVVRSTGKRSSHDMAVTSSQERRPQMQAEAQAARLADLQGAAEAHFALLDHLKGLLSTASLSAADGISEISLAVDYKRSVDRVRELSALMQAEILPRHGHTVAAICRVSDDDVLRGLDHDGVKCESGSAGLKNLHDNRQNFDGNTGIGIGTGTGTAESLSGEEQLLALCKATSLSLSQPSSSQSASAPASAYRHRTAHVLQALHYYHYKAHEYEACLPDAGTPPSLQLPDPATREDLLQRALLHLQCISVTKESEGDNDSVDGSLGVRAASASLAFLSEERGAEAVVVLLALAESLCRPSPRLGGSLNEQASQQQRQELLAGRARRGAEHSSRARRLLHDLWGARIAPAEVKDLINHADEVGKVCARVGR